VSESIFSDSDTGLMRIGYRLGNLERIGVNED